MHAISRRSMGGLCVQVCCGDDTNRSFSINLETSEGDPVTIYSSSMKNVQQKKKLLHGQPSWHCKRPHVRLSFLGDADREYRSREALIPL
ncbi:unnamed protein product [Scytosiphon promiscuus]